MRRGRPGRRDAERGQAVIALLGLMTALTITFGLALDLGLAVDQTLALQRLAGDTARAGAEQLDANAYRAGTVQLAAPRAQAAARRYLARFAPAVQAQVTAGPQEVDVTLERAMPTAFLRLVHLDHLPLRATATAHVVYGLPPAGGAP